MTKYIIAPTQQIGNYWADQLEIPIQDRYIIHSMYQLVGLRGKQSQWILVEEEPFSYPERAVGRTDRRKFEELLVTYQRFIYPKLEKDI